MSQRYRCFLIPMSQRYRCFLILVGFILGTSSLAFAGEIRVLDERGLIKAAKRTNAAVKVIVAIKSSEEIGALPLLSNADGLHPEITGRMEGSSKIVFDNVEDGTWKIKWSGPLPSVSSVSIGDK